MLMLLAGKESHLSRSHSSPCLLSHLWNPVQRGGGFGSPAHLTFLIHIYKQSWRWCGGKADLLTRVAFPPVAPTQCSFSLAATVVPSLFSQDVSLSRVNPSAAYAFLSFLKFLTSSNISLKTLSVILSWKSKGEGKVGYFSFGFFF